MINLNDGKFRWIDNDGRMQSIPERLYVDIINSDPIKLAEYLIHPNYIIRRIAEKRASEWKQNQKAS